METPSKKLRFREGSPVHKLHLYFSNGGSLSRFDTLYPDKSPVGQILNLTQRINDMKHKFDAADVPCPIDTRDVKRPGKAAYTIYFYKGCGCPLENGNYDNSNTQTAS